MILETKRLLMREMSPEDFPSLCLMLMDADVMYAYGHAFSQAESKEWLERQLNRYKEYRNSFGLYAVILKSTGRMIGQCGITVQDFSSRRVYEIGYLLQKSFWHMGYALEAAQAWRDCAFETLGMDEVFSIIRYDNYPSINVAVRNGMLARGSFIKRYCNTDMPHTAFSITKKEYVKLKLKNSGGIQNDD